MNDNAIERFECTSCASDMESGAEMEPDAAGDWVRYSDHKAAVVSATNAAVAAERDACAGLAINKANRVQGYNDDMELAYLRIAAKIRARTDTDAQAALEAVKREARNEALAEAWSISDQNGDVKTATDLQKIITEGQSDE